MSSVNETLSWADFKRLAAEDALTRDVVESHVALDPDASNPFFPPLRYKPSPTSDEWDDIPSDEIAEVLSSFEAKTDSPLPEVEPPVPEIEPPLLERRLDTSRFGAKNRIRVAAEGDSWFNLPFFYPNDLIDVLKREFEIKPVGLWGDTLENMVHGSIPQYEQVLGSGLYRHFLLSGGGNDVLGSIHRFVDPRRPGDNDPGSAPSYIRPDFGRRVSELMGLFDEVADAIAGIPGVSITMYVHGYAKAIPKPGGKYIGRNLEARGFDPAVVGSLATAIVATMVGIFNDALRSFAASRSGVVYLDLRPQMRASDWNSDEIHPNDAGAARLAKTFADAIRRNERRNVGV